jgi:CheY-like chemotaxis protein
VDQRAKLRGARALVVDDNATNRDFLVEVLLSWGIVADQADSAAAALACIEQSFAHRLPYDLLLLDMHMPHRDGMDLARAIGEDTRVKAPMVLLTSAMDHDGEALRAVGIRAWLPKPLRQSSLLETLTAVLSSADDSPQSAVHPSADRTRSDPPAPASMQGVRVLAAEDNEANQQVLAGLAEYFGFHVTVVGNGREALEAIQKDASFQVVLMDCQMPVMDGYRATNAIREWEARIGRPRVPIIAVTAHALAGERDKVLDAGMDDYITKPIDFRVLARKIAHFGNVNAPRDTSVLDHEILSQLRTLVSLARPRFLIDLIEKYSHDARASLEALKRAVAEGDGTELRAVAHSLKGSSRSLGAKRVGQLCEALEQLGKSGDTKGAPDLVVRLEPALFEALRELREQSQVAAE